MTTEGSALLRPDKPLGKILSAILDQFVLNLLFMLCAMPVITLGAAAISLYEQEYAIWESRDTQLVRSYLRGVLRNFFKGLALLGIGAVMAVAGMGIWSSLILLGLPVRPTAAVIVWIVGGIFLWFLGLTGRYEQKTGITFRNAYILAIRKLPVTLALGLIDLGCPALLLVVPETLWAGYLFFLLFFFSATAACLSAGLLLHTLKKVDAEEDE